MDANYAHAHNYIWGFGLEIPAQLFVRARKFSLTFTNLHVNLNAHLRAERMNPVRSDYWGAPPIPTKKILLVFKNANEDRVLRSSEFKITNQDPKKSSSAVGVPESSVFSDEYHEITCQNSVFSISVGKKILVGSQFAVRARVTKRPSWTEARWRTLDSSLRS